MKIQTIPEGLELKTAASLEILRESIFESGGDDLSVLIYHLDILLEKAKEVQEISACMITGNC
jgi:hypothetical protein